VKIYVDKDLCAGHGRCYLLAPEVFEADDQGNGVAIAEVVPDALRAKALLGMENCPEGAISIEE
jgi:ferredoxin